MKLKNTALSFVLFFSINIFATDDFSDESIYQPLSGCYIAQQSNGEYVVFDPWNRELGRSLSLARATEIKINAENGGRCNSVQPPQNPNPPQYPPQPPYPPYPPQNPNPPQYPPYPPYPPQNPNPPQYPPQPPYPPYPPQNPYPPTYPNDPEMGPAPSLFGSCVDYDQSQFSLARTFAYSSSGLDLSDDQSIQWAINYNRNHACNTINEFANRFRSLYQFAYSSSGLDMTSEKAKEFALTQVEYVTVSGVQYMSDKYKMVYSFGYSTRGLDLSSEMARQLGVDWLNGRCENQTQFQTIVSRFQNEYSFAYSGSGLNMDHRSAIRYAADHVQPYSVCGYLIVKYSRH